MGEHAKSEKSIMLHLGSFTKKVSVDSFPKTYQMLIFVGQEELKVSFRPLHIVDKNLQEYSAFRIETYGRN